MPPTRRALMTALLHWYAEFVERDANGCHIWIGARTQSRPDGPEYGQVWHDGRLHRAHRAVYEMAVGRIGDGLHLDHLCDNPPCVNPEHLEPVTSGENLRRAYERNPRPARTHCRRGHELAVVGTVATHTGPACRLCRKERAAERYQRQKASRVEVGL